MCVEGAVLVRGWSVIVDVAILEERLIIWLGMHGVAALVKEGLSFTGVAIIVIVFLNM